MKSPDWWHPATEREEALASSLSYIVNMMDFIVDSKVGGYMGILEDINVAKSKKSSRCPIANILEKLSETDRKELQTAINDEDIEHTVLTDVLRNNGFSLGERAVGNHRRSLSGSDGTKCSCYQRVNL